MVCAATFQLAATGGGHMRSAEFARSEFVPAMQNQ